MSNSGNEKSSKSISKSEDASPTTEHWGSRVQFILSAIGLAVGLGNVWKFPYTAYQNGGSAFLIPYVICAFTFCLPVMYAEFLIGQYTQENPAKAFYLYAPAFQGLGMFTLITACTVAVFYAVVIAWSMLYLGFAIGGQSGSWTLCNNWWNTANCISSLDHLACRGANSSLPYAFNSSCFADPQEGINNGAEEFFKYFVAPRSSSITEIGSFNWPVALCIFILWALVAATNLKGIKIFGYVSYVTVPLPYLVVLILFVRGVTLDGSWEGIKLYLFEPDVSKLLSYKTWTNALMQACFSLTLGQGAHISLASHNKKNNNCFRDALMVIFFDTLMSVVGGLAVFSTLGFLAKETGKNVTDVVSAGPSLTFIVYPEAIATMPVPWLWNILLFVMLFFLGFSSEVAMVELLTGFLHSTFPRFKKWLIPILCSAVLCSLGMIIATGAGWYWFNLMADFTATTSPCVAIILELVLIIYVYGWRNQADDMEEMFGKRPTSWIRRMFSKHSLYFGFSWAVVCPLLGLACAVLSLIRSQIPLVIDDYEIPIWAEVIGWFLNLGPFLAVPAYLILNVYRVISKGLSLKYLLWPAKEHPSHDRYYRTMNRTPPEGFIGEEESQHSTSPSV